MIRVAEATGPGNNKALEQHQLRMNELTTTDSQDSLGVGEGDTQEVLQAAQARDEVAVIRE